MFNDQIFSSKAIYHRIAYNRKKMETMEMSQNKRLIQYIMA